jgi:hypothetical protein
VRIILSSAVTMAAGNGLDKMQQLFPDARPSDLDRFFRAHRLNLKVAAAKYARCVDWRLETRPHDILRDEVNEVLQTRVFYQLPGLALDGSSIVVFHGSNHQPKRFSTLQTIRAILFVVSEIFERQRNPDDPRITILIYAPKGTPVDLSGLKQLATTFSDYFPETLCKAIAFPIGFATPYLWSAAKLFLDPRTANKVHLLPNGGRPPTLTEHLAESSIPARFFAGTRDPKDEPILLPHLDALPLHAATAAAPLTRAHPILQMPKAIRKEALLPFPPPPPPPRRSVLLLAVGALVSWALAFQLEPSSALPLDAQPPPGFAARLWIQATVFSTAPIAIVAAAVLLAAVVVTSRQKPERSTKVKVQ